MTEEVEVVWTPAGQYWHAYTDSRSAQTVATLSRALSDARRGVTVRVWRRRPGRSNLATVDRLSPAAPSVSELNLARTRIEAGPNR